MEFTKIVLYLPHFKGIFAGAIECFVLTTGKKLAIVILCEIRDNRFTHLLSFPCTEAMDVMSI